MKKIYFLALALASVFATALTAQTNFKFQITDFGGALGTDAANDWTKVWTNFDPKSTVYPAPTDLTTLDGMAASLPVPGEKDITGNVTLDATKVYLLKGFIVVRNGATLTIPAGTIIRCEADLSTTPKNYASVIVERGGKINILGTAAAPVVMTSTKAAGARERGDWGGLVIAGKGKHNLLDGVANNNVQIEGFNGVTFDNLLAKIGGTDNNDNSGEIRYLRLEFGGLAFEINKEINGITLGAVGAGTKLNHIQVSYSGDDSFEWFGGSVNSSHLIAYKGTDDDFDTDNGYSGLSQFGLAVRDTAYYDLTYNATSGASTSEGFESDNEANGTASVKPITNAIFSNYTMLGPVQVGTTWAQLGSVSKAAFRRGARIRRNSSQRIVNSIFMGYRNFLMIDGDSCVRKTNFPAALALVTPNTPIAADQQIYFSNNLIVNTLSSSNSSTDTTANGLIEVARAAGSAAKLAAIDAWVKQTGPLANNINPVTYTAGTVLINPSAYTTTPDFRPSANSPARTTFNFINNPVLANLITANNEIENAIKFAPVYPNPIQNGTLFFGRQVQSFGIFDLKGNMVKYGLDTDHTTIENLASGIYFIKLDGTAQKIIVP